MGVHPAASRMQPASSIVSRARQAWCLSGNYREWVMGLVQAVKGAVGGVLADQWKDFYTVPTGLPSTAALFAAVPQGTNAGRGSNTSGSSNIISNGSKIVVPEGYGLLLLQDGAITAFVAEPGGYEWRSDDLNSQSIFAGDGLVSTFIKQSWERFKFGGQPGSQ